MGRWTSIAAVVLTSLAFAGCGGGEPRVVTVPGPAEGELSAEGVRAAAEQLSEACLTGPVLEEEEQTPAATELVVDDLIRAFYLVDDRAATEDDVREALELLDSNCASPATAQRLAVATGVEGDGLPEGGAEDSFDCDAQGINFDERQEGTCVAVDGQRVTVADRGNPATTPAMEVTLVDVETSRSLTREGRTSRRADGVFVLLTLGVRNRLEEPVEFDPGGQVELELDGDRYFNEEEGTTTIEPDEERNGTVAFEISEEAAEALETNGNVFVLPFAEARDPANEVTEASTAVLRTYE